MNKYPLSVQAYYIKNKDEDLEAKIKSFFKDEVKDLTTEIVMVKSTKEFKNYNGNSYEEWMRLTHFLLELLSKSYILNSLIEDMNCNPASFGDKF